MGVSVSATCNGLPSPTQGDKVFTMERGNLGLIWRGWGDIGF